MTIVIHNYNEEHAINLFKSYKHSCSFCINKIANINFDLYIVDNSKDNLCEERVSQLCSILGIKYQYIKAENKGYGHGHNIVISKISSDYHVICNPDIILCEDSLYQAISFMEKNLEVGQLIPDIYNSLGEREYLCKRNPTFMNQFLRRFAPEFLKVKMSNSMNHYVYLDKDYNKPIENVEYATGCFMFFRTEVLNNINGFDERYFLYMEDADITRELLRISSNIYLPQFKVIHNWERASYKSKRMMLIAIVSYLRYWLKWRVKK
ncbi:glycosyltransferase [Francisella sp. 19X1-34]|uniref:glycosyltransferase n=1 Tax=Francisella sp. 19X1-34 TaxID=3087177 RepID=UPI002E2FFE80|nr:glycosyltransferase [Francisella sp. 19X1-34]MED7788016.1 glycosyltransferase [Francisella sp. 19X1-34]